jgi:two-component system response regulator PilR (NtrC family)
MRRALVIDDEQDICEMVTRHLHKLKFETHFALTVKEAQANINSSEYELVLIDLNLTDGSGFEVMRTIRDLHLHPKIIVISAHDNKAARALAMGANLFITKPFAMQKITEALSTLKLLPN